MKFFINNYINILSVIILSMESRTETVNLKNSRQ
jgi:hypothetical protein